MKGERGGARIRRRARRDARFRRLALTVAAGGLITACVSAPPPQVVVDPGAVTTSLEALEADSVADHVITRLLDSETRLEEPDSLFAEGAIVVTDGEPRGSLPRLAGVGVGGRVQLVTTQVSTRGAFVWGVLEYRWIPMFETDALRVGVATVVIAKLRDGSWRIVHLHSSSPPGERPEMPRPAPPDTLGDAGRGGRNPP